MMQQHIVIYKTPSSWVDSILRWGLANKWFADIESFFECPNLGSAYVREWDAYHCKWASMAVMNPELVLMLSYEQMVADPHRALQDISHFVGRGPEATATAVGRLAKVPHSKARPLDGAAIRGGVDGRILDLVQSVGFKAPVSGRAGLS